MVIVINDSYGVNNNSNHNSYTYNDSKIITNLGNIGTSYYIFTLNKMNLASRNSVI